jgi:hypothetical protein
MSSKVALEQVEQLVVQLPPHEQLKLVVSIGERLSALALPGAEENRQRQVYAARLEAFLQMCDEMAAETVGAVDSAEDIRQIREERTARL